MADEAVRYELDGDVALLRLDDGKANALGPSVLSALEAGLDRAAKESRALLLVGRPGRFSGGFDLSVMRSGAGAARDLVTAGAEMLLKLYLHPGPVVIACTGHAIAAGALTVLVGDTRLGAEGDFKIGLNEVAIGMTLPLFGVGFARDRLSPRHFTRAAVQAEIYDPSTAVDAGFLDGVHPPAALVDRALAEARRLAQLPTEAYRNTKLRARKPVAEEIRRTLAADMAGIAGPSAQG
jgi:enoyl-CoA hydratase